MKQKSYSNRARYCLPSTILIISALLVANSSQISKSSDPAHRPILPRLKVSDNRRFLVTEDNKPFFWLGDTAWWIRQITLDDVDLALVEELARRAKLTLPPEETLLHYRLAERVNWQLRLTMAAVLLFAKEPTKWHPRCGIEFIRWRGVERRTGAELNVTKRFPIEAPLVKLIQQAYEQIQPYIPERQGLVDLFFEERLEYPTFAWQEAIINAVAHRDYRQRGDTIRLFVFSDRIECYSPGRLPGHVTVENLVQERYSRNEVIVQVLADMGFIERLGYGIDRMIRLMEEWELPAPIFEETTAGFRVTLRGPAGIQMVSPLPHDQGQWVHLDLNPRQEGAIRFLEKHGKITNRDLQQLYPDISDETARRDLADMVAKGLLLKIGDKKATFYILK